MVDPAQQRNDDQCDHRHRYQKQHETPTIAVGTGFQDHDSHHAEQERANERRQHVLRQGVLHQQAGRTRRDVAGSRAVG